MLLTYFLNDFERVPVAPVITGITFVSTFHVRLLLLLFLLLLLLLLLLLFTILKLSYHSTRTFVVPVQYSYQKYMSHTTQL